MAFLDDVTPKKYDEYGNELIQLRWSSEYSLAYILYVTIPNSFIKNKHIKNLARLLQVVDVEASYEDEDIEAREYFEILRVIVGLISEEDVTNLEILESKLLYELPDAEVAIDYVISYIDEHLYNFQENNEPALSEKQVQAMSLEVEDRLNNKFLNEHLEEMRKLSTDLAEMKLSQGEVSDRARDLIGKIHGELVRNQTTNKLDNETINFEDRKDSDYMVSSYISELRSEDNKLRTGYAALNRMLNGGLQEGRLYVFLGTPKSFKSGTLLNIAMSATEYNSGIDKAKKVGRKPIVLYYSMENDNRETLDRMYTYYYGTSISNETNLTDEEVTDKLYDALAGDDQEIGLAIKYAPSNSVDTNHLYDVIEELREEGYEPILLVQDYLRRIRPANKATDQYISLGNIADELSILAKVESIPVVTASQLNREATNIREDAIANRKMDIANQMRISHISESVQIQQNMDYGIIVAREKVVSNDPMGNPTSDDYIGFKLVASRDEQQEDEFGNTLDYFAYPFENGFRIEQDADLPKEEQVWGENVASLFFGEEKYQELKEEGQTFKQQYEEKNKSRQKLERDTRSPVSTRSPVGIRQNNRSKIESRLNKASPMDQI